MRNPMIVGVFTLLIAESVLFNSRSTLIWAMIFICTSHIYFISKEEPDLVERFGNEYIQYQKNVPRWLPRFTPWQPPSVTNTKDG